MDSIKAEEEEVINAEEEEVINAEEGEVLICEDVSTTTRNDRTGRLRRRRVCVKHCLKLFTIFSTFKDGWSIYIRQEIALVGFSMASLYLTVWVSVVSPPRIS